MYAWKVYVRKGPTKMILNSFNDFLRARIVYVKMAFVIPYISITIKPICPVNEPEYFPIKAAIRPTERGNKTRTKGVAS